jgi:hypothetical protein
MEFGAVLVTGQCWANLIYYLGNTLKLDDLPNLPFKTFLQKFKSTLLHF